MRLTSFLLATSLEFTAHAAPQDIVKPYAPKQVAPDTWVITGPLIEQQ